MKIQSAVLLSFAFALVEGAPKILPSRSSIQEFTSSMPQDERFMLAQKFRALCLMKPSQASGSEWSSHIQNQILNQINRPGDTKQDQFIKKFLVQNIVSSAVSNCHPERSLKSPKQEADNEDIYQGLTNILTNVFSGNLFGVIQSSVGIRSPEGLSTTVSEVLRTLLTNISSAQGAINGPAGQAVKAGESTIAQAATDQASSDIEAATSTR